MGCNKATTRLPTRTTECMDLVLSVRHYCPLLTSAGCVEWCLSERWRGSCRLGVLYNMSSTALRTVWTCCIIHHVSNFQPPPTNVVVGGRALSSTDSATPVLGHKAIIFDLIRHSHDSHHRDSRVRPRTMTFVAAKCTCIQRQGYYEYFLCCTSPENSQ